MLIMHDIERRFIADEVETTALAGVSLRVDAGEFIAIMGPSGCGKSTLLGILGTIDRPTSGRYQLAGREVTGLSEAECARVRGAMLGFIFQNFNLIDDLTIAENVALGLRYREGHWSAAERRRLVGDAMNRVGIAHRARHFPHQLSGGQQQRAAIARAIIGDPKLILADEPTGNLDTANGQQVMDILTTLNRDGATIVMVTHSPSHADLASRRIDMLDGQVVASASFAL